MNICISCGVKKKCGCAFKKTAQGLVCAICMAKSSDEMVPLDMVAELRVNDVVSPEIRKAARRIVGRRLR